MKFLPALLRTCPDQELREQEELQRRQEKAAADAERLRIAREAEELKKEQETAASGKGKKAGGNSPPRGLRERASERE
jgi:hypothetical protein